MQQLKWSASTSTHDQDNWKGGELGSYKYIKANLGEDFHVAHLNWILFIFIFQKTEFFSALW